MKDSPFRRSPGLAGVLLASVAMLASAPPLTSVEFWENEGPGNRIRLAPEAVMIASEVTAGTEQDGPLVEAGAHLTLVDGQALAGDFLGLDDGIVKWRSPWFDQPVNFDQLAVSSMRFAARAPGPAADDWLMLTFLNGDRLQARLVSMDDRQVVVETAHAGTLTLLREQVGSLRWPPDGDLLRSAHPDAPHWKVTNRQTNDSTAPVKADGTEILIEPRQDIELQLDLPQRIAIEFALEGHDGLGFELRLDVGGERLRIVSLGSELLLLRGSDFVRMGRFDTESPLALRCFWDREKEQGLVADARGTVLGRWQMDPERAGQVGEHKDAPIVYVAPRQVEEPGSAAAGGVTPGVFTVNSRGKPMTLGSFKVFEWSGREPAVRGAGLLDGPRIAMSGDRILALPATGELTITEGRVRMVIDSDNPEAPKTEFGLDEVEQIWLSGVENGSDDPLADARPGAALLEMTDGSKLQGRIRSIDAVDLIMDSVFSAEAVKLDVAALVSLDFLHSPDAAWSGEHLAGQARLLVGSQDFNGRWQAHPDARPRWLLPGATEAVPLRSEVSYAIDRSPDDEIPGLTDTLIFLTDGQVFPGEVLSILGERGDVVFQSAILDRVTIPGDRIRGLGFSHKQAADDGFRAADWRIIRGRLNENVVMGVGVGAGESKATLKIGGGIARTVVLPDKGFSFSMKLPDQAGLRVVLADESEAPDATKVAIVHSNNVFHCGFESGPQRNSCRGHFQATDERVDVDVMWDDTNITLTINGRAVANFPHQGGESFGRYVGFENVAYGSANGSEIQLHDFGRRSGGGPLDFPVLDPQAKEQILNLPRFLRDDPPRQVVLAKNGDMLRGVLEGGDQERLVLRSGRETFNIPRDRTAAVVWLTPPPANGAPGPQQDAHEPTAELHGAGNAHTILLHSGAAIIMDVESFGPDFIRGQVASLGAGTIPVADVAGIRSGGANLLKPDDALSGWQLTAAPDPLPIAGGQDGRIGEMIGLEVANFVLPLLGREAGGEPETFALTDHKGRVVVLDFWASWCAACVRSLPEKIDAFAALDPDKVTFLAVNQAEGPEQVRRFLDARGWDNLTVAMDADQAVARTFKVGAIPHCVIIGPDGRIAWASTGFRAGGSRALVEVIESLLETAPAAE